MKRLQLLAYSWAVRCFGIEHVHDNKIRALRTLEEVAEYGQAVGVSQEDFFRVIDLVYSRPKGDPLQELGGIAMTFVVLCESHKVQLPDVLMIELNRVVSKSQKHFSDRNLKKVQPSHG